MRSSTCGRSALAALGGRTPPHGVDEPAALGRTRPLTSATPAAGLSRYELWYGRAQKPVARERLAAGDLTVELEGAEIRSVRLGDLELLRNVYVALRDEEWGTVAGILSDYEISRGDDEFAVSFEMTHRQPPVAFTWTGRIEGDRSGALSYELDGLAEAAFRYCRIGFCLLHPPGCAGHRYRGNSPSGLVEGTLPLEIGPQVFERGVYWPLFPSVDELELSMDDDVELELLFEGDLFEMEDQRNWTDASFKTYCTPQELGYPFDARAGQRFRQKVTIQVTRGPSVARGRVAAAPAGRRQDAAHRPGTRAAASARADRLRAPARTRSPLRRRARVTANGQSRSPARGAGSGRRWLARSFGGRSGDGRVARLPARDRRLCRGGHATRSVARAACLAARRTPAAVRHTKRRCPTRR